MPSLETLGIDDFNQKLKSRARELKTPFEATLELTYACNLRCAHCYNPTHHASTEEFSLPELKSLLAELVENNCMLILFSGGEPFMRKDAFEIFEEAKRFGFQIAINTNATMLDPDKISRLIDLAPTLLSISVYGMTPEVYESVTGIPGSYTRFFKALALLENYPHPLLFKMPVMTLNAGELDTARKWFRKKSWPFIHTIEIHPKTNGDPAPLEVRLSPESAAKLRIKYDKNTRCGSYNADRQSKNPTHLAFDCQCGKVSFAVTPYGEMNLCVSTSFPKYSLKTGSVREGWKMLVDFVENFTPSEKHMCPSCDLAPYCTQGAMDAWLNEKDFNPCLPYFYETAGRVKTILEGRHEN